MASWNHHLNMKISNESVMDDEYHILITCPVYRVILEKYDDLLDIQDNVSVIILKFPPRRVST